MKPGPAAVVDYILDGLPLNCRPRWVVDIAVEFSVSQGWDVDENLALERAEKWESHILNRLRIELSQLNERGQPAKFSFNSSSENFIQGACFCEPNDSLALLDKKRRRLRYYDYLAALQHISHDQFELLCGKIIALLGVQNPIVTRSSADEGIDFFGKVSLGSYFFPQDLSPTVQRQMEVWLVGQAKHYRAMQAGTPELRDLVGAIALGRAGAFGSSKNPVPEMKIRVADPVFAVFITTGNISGNGWALLKRSGVIGMDGEMVAAFLADRGAGITTEFFSQEEFVRWLEA